jgi:two-component system nitrate/nitrite response regulator NarL
VSAIGEPRGERRTVRILLADDHTLLREAMRELLAFEPDFEVVGEAADGAEAVELAGRMRPDIVLLDVEMPRNVPAETVRGIRAASRSSRVIMLTMHDAPQLVRDMVESGVAGYLHKSIGSQALTAAIRGALEAGGGGRRLVMSVTHGSLLTDQAPSRLISPRERQILVLVAAAFSNRQIASRLSITEATVKRHLRNAFEKLGAVSRIDAVNRAAAAGLIHTRPMRHSLDARRDDPMATA